MGKEHLYVWEMTPGMVHENDAAERLRRMPLCVLTAHTLFVSNPCPATAILFVS
jgi:hypothetical protein